MLEQKATRRGEHIAVYVHPGRAMEWRQVFRGWPAVIAHLQANDSLRVSISAGPYATVAYVVMERPDAATAAPCLHCTGTRRCSEDTDYCSDCGKLAGKRGV